MYIDYPHNILLIVMTTLVYNNRVLTKKVNGVLKRWINSNAHVLDYVEI